MDMAKGSRKDALVDLENAIRDLPEPRVDEYYVISVVAYRERKPSVCLYQTEVT